MSVGKINAILIITLSLVYQACQIFPSSWEETSPIEIIVETGASEGGESLAKIRPVLTGVVLQVSGPGFNTITKHYAVSIGSSQQSWNTYVDVPMGKRRRFEIAFYGIPATPPFVEKVLYSGFTVVDIETSPKTVTIIVQEITP